MNKYTELSDHEINKLVTDKLSLSNLTLNTKSGIQDIFIIDENRRCVTDFNPCNNPSDAMPIIIENDIAIFPAHKLGIENWCAASGFYDIGEKEVIWDMESNNKNPLRAAMELFLIIKDAENENNNNG